MSRYDILLGRSPRAKPIKKIKASVKKIKVPLFEVASCPTIPLAEVKNRRFNLSNSNKIIRRELRTAEGRRRLAESMAVPLRRRLDYEAVSRKIFQVQPLPSLPTKYDDINKILRDKKPRRSFIKIVPNKRQTYLKKYKSKLTTLSKEYAKRSAWTTK